ncbi:MAG: ATP-dependent protease subunit HslV [Alphaproteobacteria bacterium]|nr:ATP-dependent protease subunit HslV [Alphaproteobacteria bacterium]
MQTSSTTPPSWRGTTVLSVRKGNQVVVAADGQITFGAITLKSNARKIRRMADDQVIVGFAGATADALTLFERLEHKLEQYPTQLMRACVELAKEWRTDKYLRRLEAMMAVVDAKVSLILTGNGDVMEPEDGLIGIGSGGPYALSAAKALYDIDGLSAKEIAERSMKVAADLCIYSNSNIIVESIEIPS